MVDAVVYLSCGLFPIRLFQSLTFFFFRYSHPPLIHVLKTDSVSLCNPISLPSVCFRNPDLSKLAFPGDLKGQDYWDDLFLYGGGKGFFLSLIHKL